MTSGSTQLVWGVKESFRRYVSGAGGTVSVASPATGDPLGFAFPVSGHSHDPSTGTADLLCRGEALFQAHGGVLRVLIADPIVRRVGGSILLVTADASRSSWTAIADLELTDDDNATARFVFRARLTADGATLFNEVYPPGTDLDPVVIEERT